MLEAQQEGIRPTISITDLREAAAFIPWFLIHTQPCRERSAVSKLNSFSIPTFMPLTLRMRVTGGHCPLFPSYLFASFPYDLHRDVNESLSRLPLLGRVVYFGTRPAAVAGELIQEIAKQLDDNGVLRIDAEDESFKHGETVQIAAGPMKGMLGMFDRYKSGQERAVILVSTIMSNQEGWNCSRQPMEQRGAAFSLDVDARSLVRA